MTAAGIRVLRESAAAPTPGDAFRDAGGTEVLIAASRTLHVLCVWVAVPLMFLPRANAYFRPGSRVV